MIDAILYRSRIGAFANRIHCRSHFSKNQINSQSHYNANRFSSHNTTPSKALILYLMLMTYIFMFITSGSFNLSKQTHQTSRHSHHFMSQGVTTSLLTQAAITLLTYIVRKLCATKTKIRYSSGLSCFSNILLHIRYSYHRTCNNSYKVFRKYLFWTSLLAMLLTLVCNMSLLNPGPAQNITGIYQNVRGLIPWSELGNTNPCLDVTKLAELNAYVSIKNPDVVVLNETWLKPAIHSNEIFPPSLYKIFRLDRSEKTHPRDTNNPDRFRANV